MPRAPRLQKPEAKPATDVARDHVLISQHLCASSPNLNVYATHRCSLSHRAAHDGSSSSSGSGDAPLMPTADASTNGCTAVSSRSDHTHGTQPAQSGGGGGGGGDGSGGDGGGGLTCIRGPHSGHMAHVDSAHADIRHVVAKLGVHVKPCCVRASAATTTSIWWQP